MIKNLAYLLGNIVQKVREMSAFYLAIGTMLVPLAFILKIESPNTPKIYYVGMALFGLICMLFGMIEVFREEKQRKKEAMFLGMLVMGIAEKMGVDTKEILGVLRETLKGKSKK